MCDVSGFVVLPVEHLGHVIVLRDFRPSHGIDLRPRDLRPRVQPFRKLPPLRPPPSSLPPTRPPPTRLPPLCPIPSDHYVRSMVTANEGVMRDCKGLK